jgi:phenylpyruvate tautomerase PptA (4-oxalocrotonate tautomerase family)
MGARQRLNAKISSVFHHICCRKPEAAQVAFDDVEKGGIKQYRLEATRKVR